MNKRDPLTGLLEGETRHPITGCNPGHLFGMWLIEPVQFEHLQQQALSYDLKQLADDMAKPKPPKPKPYVVEDGVAILSIDGAMTKRPTSFSEAMHLDDYQSIKRALVMARDDKAVKAIFMKYETPGGTANGVDETGAVIREMDQKIKPVISAAEDTCCSGGLWLATQGRRFTINRMGETGSLGTATLLRSTKGMYDKMGIQTYAIASGKFKMTGAPGAELTADEIAYIQSLVDAKNTHFIDAVATGRKLDRAHVEAIAKEAKILPADLALQLKLVDEVVSTEDALAQTKELAKTSGRTLASVNPSTRTRSSSMDPKTLTLAPADETKLRAVVGQQVADDRLIPATVERMETLNQQVKDLTTERDTLKAQIPAKLDPSLVQGHVQLAEGRIDLMVQQGKLVKASADEFKAQLKANGEQMVTAVSGGKSPINLVLDSIEKAPTGVNSAGKPETFTQIPSPIPGTTGDPSAIDAGVNAHLKSMNDRFPIPQAVGAQS